MKKNTLTRQLYTVGEWFGAHYPEAMVRLRYLLRFHNPLNLHNPQTLNEKILYLSLRTDTTEWTRLADKYHVREYVKECGYEDCLTKLYAYWQNPQDVDLSLLPDSFVIKSVQGSGDVIIVKAKQNIDIDALTDKIRQTLFKPYGAREGGKHYMRIKPAVVAEELLREDGNHESTYLTDYKVWCFSGKAHYILTCRGRDRNGFDAMIYDTLWHPHPEAMLFDSHRRRDKTMEPPEKLQEMLSMAETLSAPFPEVRVDFYIINNRIYFGEMTFTALGGMMKNYSDDFQLKAGSLVKL